MGFPRKESELVVALPTFGNGIAANTALYQVGIPDSISIQAAVSDFLAARAVAVNPATRTVGSIDLKDAKMASALGICRVFYRQIQNNVGVSNDDKLLIGVTPLSTARTKRNCPQTTPGLNAVAATQGAHTLTYFNSVDPNNRSKPFGATEIELFVAIAADEVESAADAKFYRKFTTNPMAVFFTPADKNKTATYFARWAGIRGDVSPFSAGVSLPIAA
jgi:hypothetical protein